MKIATCQERLNELFDSDPRNDSAIAADLEVSKQTVSAWRNGSRSPKKPMLEKIADVYKVNLDWLMGFDVPATTRERIAKVFYEENKGMTMKLDLFSKPPDETPKTEEARILSRGIDRLSPEERVQALAVVKAMFAQHPEIFKD